MRLLKTHIGIVVFVLLAWCGTAQNTDFYWSQLNDSSNRLQGKLMGKVYYLTATANSNFFYPNEWLNGTITLTDGDKFENMRLRLHMEQDELVAYNENNSSLYFVEKELVKSFTLEKDGNTQLFRNLEREKGTKKLQYFEELYSGTMTLLVFRYMYEHKVSPYNDKLGVMRDTEYRVRLIYYLYTENDSLQKIIPKRSGFIHSFPEHKKAIKKLFRKNNLFVEDTPSMVRACFLLDEAGLLQE